jgi:hypothetical protein
MDEIVKIRQALQKSNILQQNIVEDDIILSDPRFDDICSELGAVYYCPNCRQDEAAMFFNDVCGVLSFICSCGYKGFFVHKEGVFGRTSSVWDKLVQ